MEHHGDDDADQVAEQAAHERGDQLEAGDDDGDGDGQHGDEQAEGDFAEAREERGLVEGVGFEESGALVDAGEDFEGGDDGGASWGRQ